MYQHKRARFPHKNETENISFPRWHDKYHTINDMGLVYIRWGKPDDFMWAPRGMPTPKNIIAYITIQVSLF